MNTLFVDSSNSVRYHSCVSPLANLEIRVHQWKNFNTFGTRDQHLLACQRRFTNFGNFLGSRTDVLKNWKAGYSGLSNFRSGGIGDSDDGSDDDSGGGGGDDDGKGTKTRKFKNKSARRKDSNAKYSTKVQKAGNSSMRPSRYAFMDLREEDEDQRWVRRPKDDNLAKRQVEWYAKQMAHLVSERQVSEIFDLKKTLIERMTNQLTD